MFAGIPNDELIYAAIDAMSDEEKLNLANTLDPGDRDKLVRILELKGQIYESFLSMFQ
jgi:hypothetical protein